MIKNHLNIATKVKEIIDNQGVLPAVEVLLEKYEILLPNVHFALKPTEAANNLVVTTEGDFGPNQKQTIRVPENLFDFPMEMVVNMLAHEIYHVQQKTNHEH